MFRANNTDVFRDIDFDTVMVYVVAEKKVQRYCRSLFYSNRFQRKYS